MTDLRRRLKHTVLGGLELIGGFAACRTLTAGALRILCYHGISVVDEHEFQGKLFMRSELFRRRMTRLLAAGYRVLPLAEAVRALQAGALPDRAVALTFDDGWYGMYRHALPMLVELKLPATLYITTYYAERRTPVFNVAVDYLFWRAQAGSIDLSPLGHGLDGRYDLKDPSQRAAAAAAVSANGDARLSAEECWALLLDLASRLNVDATLLSEQRVCGLMHPQEIAAAAAAGFDIQLHTHRHTLMASNRASVVREITDNRVAIARIVPGLRMHFSYPSGKYHARVWPWLEDLGIETAATTQPGLNYQDGNRLALFRFVDGENIAPIDFAAELAGALDVIRWVRSAIKRGPAGRALDTREAEQD
jgi:peptidoglycan/xylan/chitin deacetylase (PgdA/CDA1 family)